MADEGKDGGAEAEAAPTVEIAGTTYPALADGEYDAIIMGTGLKECIIAGLLSVNGMKVLQVDRNGYYGADCASLNLTNLFKKFRGADAVAPHDRLGQNRDYNVDLIPKFLMACGKMVKILLHTKVTRYLEFKAVSGSFVAKGSTGAVNKVPATATEAVKTPLVGFFQKRKLRNLLQYVAAYDPKVPATHKGFDAAHLPTAALFDKFGVDANTQDFIGHAIALHSDERYKGRPAILTIRAMKLYAYSLERYGSSPYIYPIYGLGGLPEGFSRLCAINGGTFMLNRDVDEILFDADGVARGIKCGGEAARGALLIGDPSYFGPDKLRVTGRVVRSICLMNHPIPAVKGEESAQIIIPAGQCNRAHDVYVSQVSFAHCVAPRGIFIAIVSTEVETGNPMAELEAGLRLLGPVLERFDSVSECYAPVEDGTMDRCFISASYDASSHFETTAADVLAIYERVTGTPLDMSINADTTDPEGNY